MKPDQPEILLESIVAYPDWEAIVAIRWGAMAGQLPVAEARQHALKILEVAEGAEHDAAFMRLFVEQRATPPREAAAIMRQLREHRGTRR